MNWKVAKKNPITLLSFINMLILEVSYHITLQLRIYHMMKRVSGPLENMIAGSEMLCNSLSYRHTSKLSPEEENGWKRWTRKIVSVVSHWVVSGKKQLIWMRRSCGKFCLLKDHCIVHKRNLKVGWISTIFAIAEKKNLVKIFLLENVCQNALLWQISDPR